MPGIKLEDFKADVVEYTDKTENDIKAMVADFNAQQKALLESEE